MSAYSLSTALTPVMFLIGASMKDDAHRVAYGLMAMGMIVVVVVIATIFETKDGRK